FAPYAPYAPGVGSPYAPASAPGGFYVGVHGGYGWGEADHTPDVMPVAPFEGGYDMALDGVFLGAQVGGNFPLTGGGGPFVGFEVDGTWSGMGGSLDTGPNFVGEVDHEIDWSGSARGKA